MPDIIDDSPAIRVDEAWAVVGATAAPPRAHAHRIELLHEPVTVVERCGLDADEEFPETDLTELAGLGGAPRGIVGAVLWLRGRTTEGVNGVVRSRMVQPFIAGASPTERWPLNITVNGANRSAAERAQVDKVRGRPGFKASRRRPSFPSGSRADPSGDG